MNLIRLIIILCVLASSIFANVELKLSSNTIKGEPFLFSIVVSGSEVIFPDLSSIAGKSVQEISSSTSTQIYNSRLSKKVKKVYSLYPSENFIFPSLKFIIDSKEYNTKAREINITSPKKTISPNYSLSLEANKKDLYIGESFVLNLIFRYKKNSNILDLSFEKPIFDDFWHKQINDSKQYEDGDFAVQELKFLLFPLKEGIIKINPLKINAQLIDSNSSFSFFSNTTKNVKIFSNALEFNIKKLPDNINLIGNFDIETKVDKLKINKGESISYKLEIKGIGNIDDIKDFTLDIKDATIYENKPIIKTEFKNGIYSGVYTKVFSIVPNKSITIPSFDLEYFDKNLGFVLLKQSKEIKIEVLAEKVEEKEELLQKIKNDSKIERKEIIKIIEKASLTDRIMFFLLGSLFTVLILYLYKYVINYIKKDKLKDLPLIIKIKKSKTKNELLKIVSKFLNVDTSLDKLIFELEKCDDILIIKKDIIKVIKELNL